MNEINVFFFVAVMSYEMCELSSYYALLYSNKTQHIAHSHSVMNNSEMMMMMMMMEYNEQERKEKKRSSSVCVLCVVIGVSCFINILRRVSQYQYYYVR